MKTVFKILAALAALVGIAYVIATYGDKIVSWCKDLLNCCDIDEDDFADSEEAEEVEADEEIAEEIVEEIVEEIAEEEPAVEEAPVEEIVADEAAPIADEEDFEG